MSISLISKIKPQNNGAFPVYDDVDGYGGFQVQPTITSMEAIPALNRKPGMLVYVLETSSYYQLATDLTTWQDAVFASGPPTGSAGGDLSGTYPNPNVIKIQGNSIATQSLGASQDGYTLRWDNVDGYWKASITTIDLGNANQISGILPVDYQASQTLGGDLSGTTDFASVLNIHGASVPVAGSLTTGDVLQVSGVSSLTYAQISNSNVSSSAAIDGSKISPNFGSQNSTTTGSSTASSFVIGTSGPSITSGSGAPGSTLQAGSLYLRTDGYGNDALYTYQSSNWLPIGSGNTTMFSANYTALGTDYIITSNPALIVPTTITLPASPHTGQKYIIKDGGGIATSYNITISGNGNLIDGASTYTLGVNYAWVQVVFYSGAWRVINSSTSLSGSTPGGSAGGDLTGTYPNPTVATLTGTGGVVSCPSEIHCTGSSALFGYTNTNGSAGNTVTIQGQDSSGANAGLIYIAAGSTTNSGSTGGGVTMNAGQGSNGIGGTISISAGLGGTGAGGNVNISAGQGSTTGGNITIKAGEQAFPGTSHGTISLKIGSSLTPLSIDKNKIMDSSVGRRYTITNTSTNYTALVTDYIIFVDTSGGARTITLPASPTSGDTYIVKDHTGNAGTNTLRIKSDVSNTYTVDGNTNDSGGYTITTNYGKATVCFDGSNWSVIA